MAKVGDSAHTPHGIGQITEVLNERGRLSYKVAGRGFSVWMDETKIHVANEGAPLFSYEFGPEHHHPSEKDMELSYLGGLENTIEQGPTFDNHTTLPWDPTPQYGVDLFRKEQTILPGDYEIDPDKRLRPSDSVSGESRSTRGGPQPNPNLFDRDSSQNPFADERTAALHRYAGEHDNLYTRWQSDSPHPHEAPTHDPRHYAPPTHEVGMGDDEYNAYMSEDVPNSGGAHETFSWDRGEQHGGYHPDEPINMPSATERAGAGRHRMESPTSLNPFHNYEKDEPYQGQIPSYVLEERMHPPRGGGDFPVASYRQADGQDVAILHMNGFPNSGVSPTSHAPSESCPQCDPSGAAAGLQAMGSTYRPAGLSDRYAHFEMEADNHDDPVAQFRRDPVGYIHMCGHLWTDGDDSLEKYADYTRLIDIDPTIREAAWSDVRTKAMRLRHEGKVQINDIGENRIYATVQGDNGTYDTMIAKGGGLGGGQSVSDWNCSCEWGRWAFKRQMTYVGRLCSHAYAAYLDMQSQDITPAHFKPKTKYNPMGKSAAVVDEYKSWLKTNNQAPEAASIASFLHTTGGTHDESDVDKLYDYISGNPDKAPERKYDIPYVNDPDEAYKTADLLRQKPQSLSPNLRQVPEKGDNQWVDVTKDEREDTGPDDIVHFSSLATARALHPNWRQATDTSDDILGATSEAHDAGMDPEQLVASLHTEAAGPPGNPKPPAPTPGLLHNMAPAGFNPLTQGGPESADVPRVPKVPDSKNPSWSNSGQGSADSAGHANLPGAPAAPKPPTPAAPPAPGGGGGDTIAPHPGNPVTNINPTPIGWSTPAGGGVHPTGQDPEGYMAPGPKAPSPGGGAPSAPKTDMSAPSANPAQHGTTGPDQPPAAGGSWSESQDKSPIHNDSYKINQGDTLSDISTRAFGDSSHVNDIAKANNISDPNMINSGDMLKLPGASTSPSAVPGPPGPDTTAPAGPPPGTPDAGAPPAPGMPGGGPPDTSAANTNSGLTAPPAPGVPPPGGPLPGPANPQIHSSLRFAEASDGQLLDKLREMSTTPAADDNGHMDAHNDRLRDLVDELNDRGYDASFMVAALDPKATDGDGNFLGQSSPSWADEAFGGSGPDPKDWISDSAGYVDENEVPHHEKDWTEGDGDIIKFNDSRSKPQQGPRTSSYQLMAELHGGDESGGSGYFNPNNPSAEDWYQGSGEPFMEQVSQGIGGGGGMGGGGGGEEGGAAEGGAAGGELAEAAPELLALAGRQPRQLDGAAAAAAFDRGEFLPPGAAPGGGDLRSAQRVGRGATQHVRVDPGFRQPRREFQAMAPPEDFGFDGVPEMGDYGGADPSGSDIVANFQRSGAAAALESSSQPQPGSSDDFASSPMVQAMLRTAGRVFSPEEQRELEAEYHPQGARNMPTEEDLAGTHYLMGI